MVYSDNLYNPSLVELARAGNFQAIAHWINQALMPYGIRAYVGGNKPGCLKVLVEFQLSSKRIELSKPWRDHLVRFICHRIWKLNSARIEGVRIAARAFNGTEILWEQSVKVVSPARRSRKDQSSQLQSQIQQTANQKAQLKLARSLLMSGPLLFAFVFGSILGFNKAPVEQTNASAAPRSKEGTSPPVPTRPDMVQTALETVPVTKHNDVVDPKDPTVTLMFAGDVTLSDSFADAIGKDYERTFANMNEYRLADLAMVNLENPMTRSDTPLPDKQFNFKADPDAVKVLTDGGIDLVNLANNHAMDYQEPGLLETMDTLNKAKIHHIGAGRDVNEARRPDIIDVKGQRIAYLGYYSADFENAGDRKAGTNFAEEQRIAEDIKAIRDQVDWIVVNYHWGEELATHPADWQVKLAHFTIDQGADVVVGHHPHVLQGAEVYRGRPIAYSLGNFIFGGNSRSDYDTAVLKVALKDNKQMKVEFLPVAVREFQPKVVKGDQGEQILQQISDLSSGFQQPMESPVVLDARFSPPAPATPSPAAPPNVAPGSTDTFAPAAPDSPGDSSISPSVQPFESPDSSVPAESSSPTDTTPSYQPDSSIESATPSERPSSQTDTFSEPPSFDSEQSPSSDETTPSSAQPQPGVSSPSDSFINSPSHTPFNSGQSEQDGASSNSLDSNSSSDPASSPQENYLNYQGTTQEPETQEVSLKQAPEPNQAMRPTASPRSQWPFAEQVGAALIPDVSLLAATVW